MLSSTVTLFNQKSSQNKNVASTIPERGTKFEFFTFRKVCRSAAAPPAVSVTTEKRGESSSPVLYAGATLTLQCAESATAKFALSYFLKPLVNCSDIQYFAWLPRTLPPSYGERPSFTLIIKSVQDPTDLSLIGVRDRRKFTLFNR